VINIQDAKMYSMKGEMAYQIDYDNGVSVRSVVSPNKIIRNEYKTVDGWKQAGKPYVIAHSKNRQAERVVREVVAWLN
jgi:uncharacterized alpha/beta hydrolase family protein